MDKKTNILLAKKYMVESIYRSANVEGVCMTFPETQTICEGMSVAGHSIDEINTVNDLKNAWKWIFENIDQPINIHTLKKINRIARKYTVINAGSIRTIYDEPIRVPLKDGNNFYPELPGDENKIDDEIKKITSKKTLLSALELFCYVCKRQYFNDGNKRTATLITNMYMIQNGFGILSIPIDKILVFYNALTDYYASDNARESLIDFLKTSCITGNQINKKEPY